LFGRQNIPQPRLDLALQGRQLPLLISGQVQLFLRQRRQQVKAALTAWAAAPIRRSAFNRLLRHPTRRSTESDIHRRSTAKEAGMGRRRPKIWEVSLASLVGDGGAVENGNNGGRSGFRSRGRGVVRKLPVASGVGIW
jgi:hypothetical protein